MADSGYLVVCATPIGNLGDASERLAQVLGDVDLIYVEDTRRTAKLLAHLGIDAPTRSLFEGNEAERTEEVVADVLAGRAVALVTDAGMPTISDPGARAVSAVREAGGRVMAIPGPSAVTLAIALSGFPGDRFVFEGFLPKKGREREERLSSIGREERPVVLFASPHRLGADLDDIAGVIGDDRQIAVNRELTKVHEEVWVGTIGDARRRWSDVRPKGELTLVIGPGKVHAPRFETAVSQAADLVRKGASVSDAAREVAEASGHSRRELYQALLRAQERS